MISFKKEKLFFYLKLLFPVLLLLLVIFELRKMFLGIDTSLLMKNINELNLAEIVLIVAGGFLSILPMIYYDLSLTKLLHIEIPKKEIIEYSIISNTFSNLLGFGGLIGAGLRSYFYGQYEGDRRKLLTKIGLVSLFSLTGMSLLAWLMITGIFHSPLFSLHKWLYAAIWIVGLYLPFYLFHLFRPRKQNLESPISIKMATKMVVASFFEWFTISLFLLGICYLIQLPVSFSELMPIFIIASSAGIISMIPGGLGSFDLVFLWGLQALAVPDEKAIVLLLLYRITYFLIPFFIGVFLLLKLYWSKWNQSWNQIPSIIVQNVSHFILTGLVFLSGIVLLLSAAMPGVLERLKIMEEILSFSIMNLSHHLSVAMGFVLLGVSRGIEYKSKQVYRVTMLVLILASVFTFFKGLDYEEAIFIIIVAILLWVAKDRFYRENFVLTWGKMAFDILLIIFITAMYLGIGYINLPNTHVHLPTSIMPYVIENPGDLFVSAIVGLMIAIIFMVIGNRFSDYGSFQYETSNKHESEVLEHLNTYKGNSLAHLLFLHDKFLFWNQKKDVLFPFNFYADKMIILGDPLGNHDNMFDAIEEVLDSADRYGYTPVFYQVRNEMVPYLHEHGFDFFKLGEEAYVDLDTFNFSGKRGKKLRTVKNKFERESFSFKILEPPFSNEILNELQYISDEWLRGRKEKGFSLGFFDRDYLQKAPIGILSDPSGKNIGFVSLMPNYDQNYTISVDLMRFLPNSPNGTMDYIFLLLFEWAKESGYSQFNLGMAPLANVGASRFSFLRERIAAQIFLHGQLFYHFKGLKNFKEKYADYWEPKYLAYRKKSSLPVTMLQVSMLISKKVRS